MDSTNKISQDLQFLSKLIRQSDCYRNEFYQDYNNCSDKCVSKNCVFKSEFNLELIGNLDEVFDSIRILKDDSLIKRLIEQIITIIMMDDKYIKTNADSLVFMNCMVYVNKSNYNTTIQYLNKVQELILKKKVEHIKNLKQKFLSQIKNLNITKQIEILYPCLTSKRFISKDAVDAYTHITHTHKVLEINSSNVIWSGSSAYYLGWTETNSAELVDIDLFIIGTREEKEFTIQKIKTNLIDEFGSKNIIFKTCGSVGYIFIKGIPRIIQLICWGGPKTTGIDVISHFDFDYLKSFIKYDEKYDEYTCYSMDCAVKSIESKTLTTSMDLQKIKPYRFAKAHANGFASNPSKTIEFGSNDYFVTSRNKLAKEYYASTSNLTQEFNDLDFDLENLFGVCSARDLVLEGTFDAYTPYNSLRKIDLTKNFKLTSAPQIFDEEKIVFQAKVLSFHKFDHDSRSELIVSIGDTEVMWLVNRFAKRCTQTLDWIKSTYEANPKFKQHRTSSIVKDGNGFTKENLHRVGDAYYEKILEQIDPYSMIIRIRDGCSYDYIPGQTYIIRGDLRAHISESNSGVSFKLR